MTIANINKIKVMYPEGTRIILLEKAKKKQALKGIVKMVDNEGLIHVSWEDGETFPLNVNEDNFIIDSINKIKVLLVEPGKYAKIIEIENTLEAKQAIVKGLIQMVMPYEDEVAIICNDEGKLNHLPLNRAIYNDWEGSNEIVDIIAGDFIVVYAPSDSSDFYSLPDDLMKKYEEKFKYPEHFYRIDDVIYALKYDLVNDELHKKTI